MPHPGMEADGEAEDLDFARHAQAEEEDEAAEELMSLSGEGGPKVPRSENWAPGLAASVLFGPRALRRSMAPVPSHRSSMRLRAMLDEVGEPGEAGCRGFAPSTGAASLLTLGLLAVLLHTGSQGGGGAAEGMLPKGTTQLTTECTKVACVGASITRGNVVVLGGELASNKPYPLQLEEMLGPGYCVENFGVPGSTVLHQSRKPFWEQPELQRVKKQLPDIVVIQFGANDSREKNFEQDFRRDYADIIGFFRSLPSNPQVYIMAMPPIYPGTASEDGVPGKKYGMNAEQLGNLRVPLNLIAKENGLSPPITVLNAFKKHCPDMESKCDWMSGDGVHPNPKGDAAMARLVHLTIMGDNHCVASEGEKEQCGNPLNVTEASCKEQGCCYTPDTRESVPWCFHKKPAKRAAPEECSAGHDEKTDCGFEGDSMEQCQARGCCYKPSLDGTPWCFHRLQPRHPVVAKGAHFAPLVTSTSGPRLAATTTTTRREEVATGTVTTTSTATRVALVIVQEEATVRWPIWLLAAGSLSLSCAACLLLVCRSWQPPKEEKQLEAWDPLAEALQRQEQEEHRRLRRLQQEAEIADQKREEDERLRSSKAFVDLMKRYGFASVNDCKKQRSYLLRTSYCYPLHVAVEDNRPEVVRLLLQNRADPALRDSRKRTPLALAQELDKKDSHAGCIRALRSTP